MTVDHPIKIHFSCVQNTHVMQLELKSETSNVSKEKCKQLSE